MGMRGRATFTSTDEQRSPLQNSPMTHRESQTFPALLFCAPTASHSHGPSRRHGKGRPRRRRAPVPALSALRLDWAPLPEEGEGPSRGETAWPFAPRAGAGQGQAHPHCSHAPPGIGAPRRPLGAASASQVLSCTRALGPFPGREGGPLVGGSERGGILCPTRRASLSAPPCPPFLEAGHFRTPPFSTHALRHAAARPSRRHAAPWGREGPGRARTGLRS